MCLGVPGQIISIDDSGALRQGRISFSGIIKDVCLAYVPEARVGNWCVVHVGFALSLLDETEAQRVFQYLEEFEELDDAIH